MTDHPLLKILQEKKYLLIALGIGASLFTFNYYLMSTLPGEANLSCELGGSLTLKNIIFSLALSILTGILFSGLTKLITQKNGSSKGIASLSGISVLSGSLTVFCTFCTIPVITVFGASVGLSFITFYETPFQLASIALMLIALKLLNKQLKGECTVCTVKQSKTN